MPLTDTFVRQVKHSGKPAGDKHTDGGGMYLLVKAAGKYWRMDYTYRQKRKTLAIGVYQATSLRRPGSDGMQRVSFWRRTLTPAPPSTRIDKQRL